MVKKSELKNLKKYYDKNNEYLVKFHIDYHKFKKDQEIKIPQQTFNAIIDNWGSLSELAGDKPIITLIQKIKLKKKPKAKKNQDKKETENKNEKEIPDEAIVEQEDDVPVYYVYKLMKQEHGWPFSKINCGTGNEIEISYFDKIEKVKIEVHKITGEIENGQVILTTIKNKTTVIDNNDKVRIKLRHALDDATRSKYRHTLNTAKYQSFIKDVLDLPEVHKQAVNCCGFYNGNYMDPEWGYKIYQKERYVEDGLFQHRWNHVNPNKRYLEFLKLKYDEKIVAEVLRKINYELPRQTTDGRSEKLFLKICFAWAISGIIKFELKQQGVNLFPYIILCGRKDTGKTTRARLIFKQMWNSMEKTAEHFKGTAGSRLGDVNPDTFPLFIDELTTLRHWEAYKNGATNGYLQFPKGRTDGSYKEAPIYKPIGIATNNALVQDEALRDRMTVLNYNFFKHTKLDPEIIMYLNDNIVHLGKLIYDKLITYDFDKIVKDIKKRYSNYHGRQLDKLIYYKVGEFICNDIGIYSDIDLPEKDLLIQDVEQIRDRDKILKESVKRVLLDSNYGNKGHTVEYFLHKKEFREENYGYYASRGIYFGKNLNSILLGKDFLQYLNDILLKKGLIEVANLEILAEELKLEKAKSYRATVINLNEGDSFLSQTKKTVIKHCLKFCSADDFLELEEDSEDLELKE